MPSKQQADTESFWSVNAPTRNIFLAILTVYIITTIFSIMDGKGLKTSYRVLYYLGQNNARVLSGHVYLLVSAIFVHASLVHFLSNALFLFIYGLRAEERFYDRDYYIIFFASALLGNLLTLLVFPPNSISTGASGGIFGLLGADLVLAYEESSHRSLLSYAGTGFIFYLLSSGAQVNYLAHAIGLLSGILLPYFLLKKRKPIVVKETTEPLEVI